MIVLTFKPQFAPKVRDGSKKQTIRPERRRPVRIGDKVSLRMWSGLPYRSPQTILLRSVISQVLPIEFKANEFILTLPPAQVGGPPSFHQVNSCFDISDFAKADGFDSWDDMVKWFSKTHGLPFLGTLIKWI